MALLIAFTCEHCGKRASHVTGHINRARKRGMHLYCDRTCAGLARRLHKSKAQRVEEKREYDMAYRKRDPGKRKLQRAAYHKRTYDPAKAAEKRKERMPFHAEYCRRPEYKRWKQAYDKRHRADKNFGPFAEAFLLLSDLENEISSRMTRYEIGLANGTINKALKRRREHAAFVSGRP